MSYERKHGRHTAFGGSDRGSAGSDSPRSPASAGGSAGTPGLFPTPPGSLASSPRSRNSDNASQGSGNGDGSQSRARRRHSGSGSGTGSRDGNAGGDDVGGAGDAKAGPTQRRDTGGGPGTTTNAGGGRSAFVKSGVAHNMSSSRNRRLAKFVLKGPLKEQPREWLNEPSYSWPRLFGLTTIIILALFTMLSFEIVCLFKDVCFRTDEAVVTLGSLTALPFSAVILLVLTPLGFYGAFYYNRCLLMSFIVGGGVVATLLLLGASFSWAESSDSASLDHANAEWDSLTMNEQAYFNNNVLEMRDSYQDSALMFGFVAFVGFIVLAASVLSATCLCIIITSPQMCGRARDASMLG